MYTAAAYLVVQEQKKRGGHCVWTAHQQQCHGSGGSETRDIHVREAENQMSQPIGLGGERGKGFDGRALCGNLSEVHAQSLTIDHLHQAHKESRGGEPLHTRAQANTPTHTQRHG